MLRLLVQLTKKTAIPSTLSNRTIFALFLLAVWHLWYAYPNSNCIRSFGKLEFLPIRSDEAVSLIDERPSLTEAWLRGLRG